LATTGNERPFSACKLELVSRKRTFTIFNHFRKTKPFEGIGGKAVGVQKLFLRKNVKKKNIFTHAPHDIYRVAEPKCAISI
jgi:hypothetical protein